MTSAATGPIRAPGGMALQTGMDFGTITILENGKHVQKRVMVTLLDQDGRGIANPENYKTMRHFDTLATHINGLVKDLITEHTNHEDLAAFYRDRTITGLQANGVNSTNARAENRTIKYKTTQEIHHWHQICNSILRVLSENERQRPVEDDQSHRRTRGVGAANDSESDEHEDLFSHMDRPSAFLSRTTSLASLNGNAFASNSDDDDSDGGFDTAALPPRPQVSQTTVVEEDDLLTRLNPTSLKIELMPVPEDPPEGQPSVPGRDAVGAATNRQIRAPKRQPAATSERAPVDPTASPKENKGANRYYHLAPVPMQKRTGNGGGIASLGDSRAVGVSFSLQNLDALDLQ